MALIINTEKGDIEIDAEEVLDLTDKGLKKLEKCGNGNVRSLLLDNNDLTRLENVESYGDLLKLSVVNNKLVRMYGVCRLAHLRILNLANNSIVAIEGMKELVHLTWLRLAGNKIKTIEHITHNGALEYLDLSNNCITALSNVCHLKVLHTLILDDNNIKSINHAVGYLPATLAVLSLANNALTDLNQISYLCGLSNLENLCITNNPCVMMTGCEVGFDYRPFVINWCQNLKLLDGFMVGSKESLKAEWLYSMGKGRHYQLGEHAELSEYLSGVCPLTSAENLVSEEDAKLSRILNKRRQHQQQLLQELSLSSYSAGSNNQRRPATAPAPSSSAASRSASNNNFGTGLTSSTFPVERSASSAAVTSLPGRMSASYSGPSASAAAYSGAMSASMSASVHHKQMVSPAKNWPAAKKRMAPEGLSGKQAAEEPAFGPYELVGLMARSYPDHYSNGDDTTMFIVSPPDVPSDVPDLGPDVDSDAESPVGGPPCLLRSESQYVPVPETMLSPDFRPVGLPPLEMPDGEGAFKTSDAQPQQQQQPPTPEPDVRPRWLQRSAIPRSTYSGHSPPITNGQQQPSYDCDARAPPTSAAAARSSQARSSATDSPILRRPTQVLRLQRTARPLSLSPSCGRRSPAAPCRTFAAPSPAPQRATASASAVAATTTSSSSDDDSTDSDVSVSKLALVRGAAQSKIEAIVRRSVTSSMESSIEGQLTTETDRPSSSSGQPGQGTLPASVPLVAAPVVVVAAAAVLAATATGDGSNRLEGGWTEGGAVSSAAVKVQALWRGFRARNRDPRVMAARQELRVRRAEDHVSHVTEELARTRRDLERERRLRELQTEAIRALWKEVQGLQDSAVVLDHEEPERVTPCDSGIDSPNLAVSGCPLVSVTSGELPGSSVRQRRSGSAPSVNRSERNPRVSNGNQSSSARTRPASSYSSSRESCGPSRSASLHQPSRPSRVTSPMTGRRRRDVNDNEDAEVSVAPRGRQLTAGPPAAPQIEPPANRLEPPMTVAEGDTSAAEKMVHLTDTCNNLQTQVQQLQEALRTISCLLLGSHLQNRPILPEALQAVAMANFCPAPLPTTNPSPPFFSAVASPLSNEVRPCISTSVSGTDHPIPDGRGPKLASGAAVEHSPASVPLSNGFSVNGFERNDDEERRNPPDPVGVGTITAVLEAPPIDSTAP